MKQGGIMRCLTTNECNSWLEQHDIMPNPYRNNQVKQSRVHYIQFSVPQGACIGFFRRLFCFLIDEFSGMLFVINDYSFNVDCPDELAMISMLRRSCGETRPVINAPGQLFESSEVGEAISLCSVVNMYGWSAYVYLTSGLASMLLWEGTLIDFWSKDEEFAKYVMKSVQDMGLKITVPIR